VLNINQEEKKDIENVKDSIEPYLPISPNFVCLFDAIAIQLYININGFPLKVKFWSFKVLELNFMFVYALPVFVKFILIYLIVFLYYYFLYLYFIYYVLTITIICQGLHFFMFRC